MTTALTIITLYLIGYTVGSIVKHIKDARTYRRDLDNKLNDLTNDGVIDVMHHAWSRYQHVTFHLNRQALWEKWIRL